MKPDKKPLSRREFLRMSALGVTGLVLASCGGGGAAPAPAEKKEEAPAAKEEKAPAEAPAAEKVTIRYQSREPEMAGGILQLWEAFYPKFQEDNPNIEVDFLPDPGAGDATEKALAQMVAGNAPDLTEWCCWQSTLFLQKGETLNLQPFIDRDAKEVNIDDYYPGQFNPWKDKGGDIHLLPRFTGSMVIYYNKDMFEKAGVEAPPSEWGAWNFDDYTEIGKKFVKKEQPQIWGTSNYGYGANWLSQYLIRGFGGNMVDPEDSDRCGLCDQPAMDALTWIHKMIWEDQVFAYGSSLGGMGVLELFLGERIPMMEMGPWNLGPVAEGARFKWDVAPMPDGPAGHTTHQSVDGTMIWKGTKNPEQSWTLMKALTSPWYGELYARYATKQPSRISVLPKFTEILREQNPIYKDIKLEVFTVSIEKGYGGPEEMFNNDQVCKEQILRPAFDQVMLENKAPVDLICRHAEIVTKFNKGEIKIDELGAEMSKVS